VVVVNLTPVPRHDYRLGVPLDGTYREVLNTDSRHYGGGDVGNGLGPIPAEARPWMNRPYSVGLTVPPLGTIILRREAPAKGESKPAPVEDDADLKIMSKKDQL
jgi:1,4-alpha-glucan branching enzyme